MTSFWLVFWYSVISALATGLGALPFAFLPHGKMGVRVKAVANGLAGALMIAASFLMIQEGLTYNAGSVFFGIICGLVFIILSSRWLHQYEDLKFSGLKGATAIKVFLILGVMTAHSFTEGVAMGFAYGPSLGFGLYISLTMALQNIPEGLAISLAFVSRGVSWRKAGLWSIFSSLPQPLMAVPAYFFVSTFAPFLPWGLGFAAGAMLRMSFSELIPESYQHVNPNKMSLVITLAIGVMMIVQLWLK